MWINGDRLWSRLEELYKVGADPEGGCTRFSYTPEYLEGCGLVGKWMKEAGMTVSYDGAGNLIGRKEGTDPTAPVVALGSHIDTVKCAGMFDGCFGVLGAIEIVQAICDAGLAHRHPIEILVFCEEEGSRFGAGLLGSRAVNGSIGKEFLYEKIDLDGKPIAEGFLAIGLDPERLEEARKPVGYYKCYLEMHIEQGCVLERNGAQLGVVSGIAGYQWLKAKVKARADHAGATPMDLRSDALIPAALVVTETEKIAHEIGGTLVATVGRLNVLPGNVNVVPGEVEMTFDIRDIYMDKIDLAVARIKEAFARICAERGVFGEMEESIRTESVILPDHMTGAIEAAVQKSGATYRKLMSGAAHDAQMMAKITDVGMMFVPSKDGLSHSTKEWSEKADLVACANVMLETVLGLV
ncbi:MAG: Zn-dependent hydrolase [Lachnospiraceae bacterium]|nr:Zn-dependent hydrolase [Lachnospiraceae bacterium]